jgi:chaperone required for assembly of F1-ATPase
MKRFYKAVSIVEAADGWRVLLDGRAVKTVGGRAQVMPTQALAQALAEEWAAQGEEIDPAAFPLRDMVDYTLDVVAADPAEAIAALIPYAETDTLCYRADPDAHLYPRQLEVWEPVLREAEARYGIQFERVSGIMHRPQSPATLAALRGALEGADPYTLAGLRNLTSLAASLVIALAALEDGADLDRLWAAASLEEEWQADLWGREWEAEERRAKRARAFASAAGFVRMARG